MAKSIRYNLIAISILSIAINTIVLYIAFTLLLGKNVEDILTPLMMGMMIGILSSLLFVYRISVELAKSITKPITEITKQMDELDFKKPAVHFSEYPYQEMDVIAQTTTKMAKRMDEYLAEINKQKMIRQEFFSNVSHELKTPITSIRGYAELIQHNFVQDEEQKKEFMQRIIVEADRMTHLINDILEISRLESGEKSIEASKITLEVKPIFEEIIRSLKPLAKKMNVEIIQKCDEISMFADPNHIREMIVNLMNNAIKYNKQNGTVIATIEKNDGKMIITVSDTGIGIPQNLKERIFERFFRVDKGRSKNVGGTGLGLSIVKHIANYYNGTIELDSKIDEGSTFTIMIPLKESK